MKIWSINESNHRIEIHRKYLIKELIVYDDRTVSSKNTLFGTKHEFVLNDDVEGQSYYLLDNNYGMGIVFDLYKNRQLILKGYKNFIWLVIFIFWMIARILSLVSQDEYNNFAGRAGRFIARLLN